MYLDREIFPSRELKTQEFASKSTKEKVTKELVQILSYLIEHPGEIKRMGANSLKLFKNGGKFSLSERNRILGEIINS